MSKIYLARGLAFLLFAFVPRPAIAANTTLETAAYKTAPGSFSVEVTRTNWFDSRRQRKVPVKIYAPATNCPCPVIIFSHGLGGSSEGYEYLGRHWAARGYISVHIQHLGSDNALWEGVPLPEIRENMRKAALSIENITNRPLDVTFVLDELD